jgi:hypothetical protein
MKKSFNMLCIVSAFLLLLSGCKPRGTPQASVSPTGTGVPASQSPFASAMPTITPGVSSGIPSVAPLSAETPAPAAADADGRIPDDQPFTNYSSAQGAFDVQAPDGWKSEESGTNVLFTKGWDGVRVEIRYTADPFTVDAVKAGPVVDLIRAGRAVVVKGVNAVTTKGGAAILVEYESNSEPQDGKQVRLENQIYYFYRGGTLAALTLWAPVGAGNAKIWAQIADTFEWRQQ